MCAQNGSSLSVDGELCFASDVRAFHALSLLLCGFDGLFGVFALSARARSVAEARSSECKLRMVSTLKGSC